jgi:hypothetical protein
LSCFCPYCGYEGSPEEFATKDQIEYAKSMALRHLADAVTKDLKRLEFDHKPKGPFGIGISMKVKPGRGIPVRRYRERQLETNATCESCSLDYAVYGLFAFCPDCGEHNSIYILRRNLGLVEKQVALAETVEDADLQRHLLEDALENCVSALDGFGREACRVFAASRGEVDPGVSFQNLERASERLVSTWGLDFKAAVTASAWDTAHHGFMKRHVIAHRAGVVDQKYIDETSDRSVEVGRRLVVLAADIPPVLGAVTQLGQALVTLLQ